MKKKLSLNQKIIAGFLFSGIFSAVLISIFANRESSSALVHSAQEKLISTRETRAFQLESLYETMSGQVKALSLNNMAIEAMENLETAFRNFPSEAKIDRDMAKDSLSNYYHNQFGGKYKNENSGKEAQGIDSMVNSLGVSALELQYTFLSANKFPFGEKDKLFEPKDGTSYSSYHKSYHRAFRSYLQEFGFYDIFLVSLKGDVVYSVFKEIDFATNLENGPHANSELAKAFKGAKNLNSGKSFLTEMNKYLPSFDTPAQFISAPVFKDDQKIGVLVFQVPVAKIDHIMTGNKAWVEQGQGQTGETYIVGKDKTMKSLARSLHEDKSAFLKTMQTMGVSKADLDFINAKNTSAVVTKVDTKGVHEVTNGKKGFDIFPDYRGVNVLSAYKPLKIEGLEWYILSEMDEDEALASVAFMQKIIMILVLVASFINLILAILFSKSISKRLVELSGQLSKGAFSLLDAANEISAGAEQLSAATQEQSASIQETSSSVNEISAMVQRSSESAMSTADLSNQSQQNASQGKRKVENLKSKIQEIHEANNSLVSSVEENNKGFESIKNIIEEINVKTNVINEIVFQTKLLSFNASVEAARAGEHGKGFAVVAEEVGALAQMSGKAASEISELLDQSTKQVADIVESSKKKISAIVEEGRQKVEEGLKEVSEADTIIESIVSDFQKVNASVQEISNAAHEQSAGVNEINQAVAQLDAATRQNSEVAHSSSVKASSLKVESDGLGKVVESIQEIVFGNKQPIASQTPSNNSNNGGSSRRPKPEKKVAKKETPKPKEKTSRTKETNVTSIQSVKSKRIQDVPAAEEFDEIL